MASDRLNSIKNHISNSISGSSGKYSSSQSSSAIPCFDLRLCTAHDIDEWRTWMAMELAKQDGVVRCRAKQVRRGRPRAYSCLVTRPSHGHCCGEGCGAFLQLAYVMDVGKEAR